MEGFTGGLVIEDVDRYCALPGQLGVEEELGDGHVGAGTGGECLCPSQPCIVYSGGACHGEQATVGIDVE